MVSCDDDEADRVIEASALQNSMKSPRSRRSQVAMVFHAPEFMTELESVAADNHQNSQRFPLRRRSIVYVDKKFPLTVDGFAHNGEEFVQSFCIEPVANISSKGTESASQHKLFFPNDEAGSGGVRRSTADEVGPAASKQVFVQLPSTKSKFRDSVVNKCEWNPALAAAIIKRHVQPYSDDQWVMLAYAGSNSLAPALNAMGINVVSFDSDPRMHEHAERRLSDFQNFVEEDVTVADMSVHPETGVKQAGVRQRSLDEIWARVGGDSFEMWQERRTVRLVKAAEAAAAAKRGDLSDDDEEEEEEWDEEYHDNAALVEIMAKKLVTSSSHMDVDEPEQSHPMAVRSLDMSNVMPMAPRLGGASSSFHQAQVPLVCIPIPPTAATLAAAAADLPQVAALPPATASSAAAQVPAPSSDVQVAEKEAPAAVSSTGSVDIDDVDDDAMSQGLDNAMAAVLAKPKTHPAPLVTLPENSRPVASPVKTRFRGRSVERITEKDK